MASETMQRDYGDECDAAGCSCGETPLDRVERQKAQMREWFKDPRVRAALRRPVPGQYSHVQPEERKP